MTGDGVVSFASSPNFEMPTRHAGNTPGGDPDNTYEITVVITDAADPDANQRTRDYVVTVTNVNERPDIDTVTGNTLGVTEVDFYFTGTPAVVHTFTATDYDDDAMDPFTWSLAGDDAADFEIGASTGDLTFAQDPALDVGPLPSFEDPQDLNTDNTYAVTVVATDDDMKAGMYAITVTVADAEEAGAVATDSPHDPPQVDDVLTFTLSDPDGGIVLTDGAIDWTVEARRPAVGMDPAGPWVEVDGSDPLALVKTYTVDEDDTGQEIRATVAYTDRRGSGKTAESDPTAAVVDERVVAPPRFRSGADQTIPEGDPGQDTGTVITATDVDGEALIWGIRGPDAGLFELIPSSGTTTYTFQGNDYPGYTAQLRAIEALDYETLPDNDKTLSLTITLSDGRGVSGGQAVYDDVNRRRVCGHRHRDQRGRAGGDHLLPRGGARARGGDHGHPYGRRRRRLRRELAVAEVRGPGRRHPGLGRHQRGHVDRLHPPRDRRRGLHGRQHRTGLLPAGHRRVHRRRGR